MPNSFPSSSVTGMARMPWSLLSTDQARLTVTDRWMAGGVSYSRSRTWVRTSRSSWGGSKPNRSSTIWVSSLTGPSRAAT